MSVSKKPIPAHLLKTALKELAANGQEKVYITEDGHLYLPHFKSLLTFHCQTNNKTYWEVVPEVVEAPASPAAKVEGGKEVKITPDAGGENNLSEDEKKKIAEAAGSAGAPDAVVIEKLKGLTVDKLSSMTKEVLKNYAALLKIEVADEETKPVIAEKILQVVNA